MRWPPRRTMWPRAPNRRTGPHLRTAIGTPQSRGIWDAERWNRRCLYLRSSKAPRRSTHLSGQGREPMHPRKTIAAPRMESPAQCRRVEFAELPIPARLRAFPATASMTRLADHKDHPVPQSAAPSGRYVGGDAAAPHRQIRAQGCHRPAPRLPPFTARRPSARLLSAA